MDLAGIGLDVVPRHETLVLRVPEQPTYIFPSLRATKDGMGLLGC